MPEAGRAAEGGLAFLPQEIIRRKRDGGVLPGAEIAAFIAGLTDGRVSGEQAAAFAMAIFLRGMDRGECVALTEAMTRSGTILDWSRLGLGGPVLDKHSTGGVGDNVSLMLAPALAACGAFVPMISGRGLGHTGGTLDKLEAIPGYRTLWPVPEVQALVARNGCAIVGATADLAPADARLYAIRDVTATVESIPLITASILSKKRAAGLQALVMDVKTGSGAFMASRAGAQALAESLVAVATGAGLPTVALITDMDEPLASAAGNAVEVRHALDHLTGARREPRAHDVTLALGAALLVAGGLAPDRATAARRLDEAFASGAAAERFARMVAALGGPTDLLERPDAHLAPAPVILPVHPDRAGIVQRIATREVGLAVVALGGGRTRPGEAVDPRVGFSRLAAVGSAVGPGPSDAPLGLVHARTIGEAAAAAAALQASVTLGPEPIESAAPVLAEIGV